jgi:carboxypeptidase Q
MTKNKNADTKRIDGHWRMLCERIGCRYSGTPGEQRAADYIEGEFRKYGLSDVRQHRFEFPNWEYSQCDVHVGRGRTRRRIGTANPMNFSLSTPPGGVTGPLVYLQAGSELDFKQDVRGKVGLLIGSLAMGDPVVRNRLIRSKLAALITVDSRVPFGWKIPVGAAPQWLDGYQIPTVCIPYMEAVRLVRELPANAEITARTRAFPAQSSNVLGDVVGTERPEEIIVVSGHHDSVAGNVGADDNASGVVFVLELARLLARKRPRRTIRFVSYGVEEKLSVGAYLYMRSLDQKETRRVVLALNADTIACRVGQDVAVVTGTSSLEKMVRRHWEGRGHPIDVRRGANPYSDHFPLNICGTPSIWLSRPSMIGDMYWTLHSVHDNLENVDASVLARTVDSAAGFLQEAAGADGLPFARRIAPDLMKLVRREARERYHHPWSPASFDYGNSKA